MFFSLIQTLVCVLLINGTLYALHLTGGNTANTGISSTSNSGNSNGAGIADTNGVGLLTATAPNNGQRESDKTLINVLSNPHLQHDPDSKPSNIESANRFTEDLADLAQLERERLMILGLAKQTAAAQNGNVGYHGRPFIMGKIQMTPADEDETDYPGLMTQQARGLMFGNVVKEPRQNDDYDSVEDFDGGGFNGRRRPIKYDYGRIVQPEDREYDHPQHMDLDGFLELESDTEAEDDIPDLDSYQYLEEILAEQQRAHDERAPGFDSYIHSNHMQNPFETLEELEANPPQALQELFEKEQRAYASKQRQHQQQQYLKQHHQQQQQQHHQQYEGVGPVKHRNGYNLHAQHQWQRKRSQFQSPLQIQSQPKLHRNIFGRQKQLKPQNAHFFNEQRTKLSIANSEATATKHLNESPTASVSAASAKSISAGPLQSSSSSATANGAPEKVVLSKNQPIIIEQPQSKVGNADDPINTVPADVLTTLAQKQKQQHSQIVHPNHKRSGVVGMSSAASSFPGLQTPVTHSIASQLMLRTARGQRQYDVPQIECPTAMDGMERFACPTPDLQGRYRCIDDHVLCDGFIDCPEGEDEDRRSCMFYKTTKAHLDVLADALLRWARGR